MDAGGQKKDVVPFGSGVGPLGTELALRHEVQQRKQLTARMDDKLRKQRIGRLRAEKKVLLGFVVCGCHCLSPPTSVASFSHHLTTLQSPLPSWLSKCVRLEPWKQS